jgi:aspartate/tyrosine/aromatic aminotransferase
MMATGRRWAGVEPATADPITSLAAALKEDPHPDKVGLCQGKYLDEQGNPYLLQAVEAAELEMALEPADHEYPLVEGVPEFIPLARDFVFGPGSVPVAEGRVSSVQTLSGTGALRVAAESLMYVSPNPDKSVWISTPSWGNHEHIFTSVGLAVHKYRYLDAAGTALDFAGLCEDLASKVPEGSVILMHSSAHNPTGVDPSPAQWDEIAEICRVRSLVPILDTAYQGFASGDPERDAYCVRKMVEIGVKPLVCQVREASR